jgi:asparagine synthase (glutamine-hydrolysing)
MSNEDGSVWLSFNGEIYNYRQLRSALESRGHHFRSDSDSETLVHLYEDHSDDLQEFLKSVRGMFAFAIWDGKRQRLLLARDRLGIKPLVYHLSDSFIAFASDLDSLTACDAVPRCIDWTSLYEYLALLTVPGPHTIFRDVYSLEPGCMLAIERGRARQFRYWQPDIQPSDTITDAGEADEMIEAALVESVRLHLVADVEVGAFLSGGIDSSLVTAMAADEMDSALRTFSAAFPGERVDEGRWAKEASAKLKTAHTEFALREGFLDDIERVTEAMDQPMALTSALSLFALSRLARERVKVVLTGDGGDELFAGYNRHRPYKAPARAVEWIPAKARPALGRIGRIALPRWARNRSSALQKAYALSTALARDEAELYAPRLYYIQPADALALIHQDALSEIDADRYTDRVRRLFESCRYEDTVSRMLAVDLQTSLADEMLSKVDRMTMAWGLEARVPLLDHTLVEIAARVPASIKRSGETGKLPLRRLAERRLGREVAERAKRGFNSPLEEWLRRDRATRSRFDALWSAANECRLFDSHALESLKERVDRNGEPGAMNLFALLVCGLWACQRGIRA